MNFRKVSESSTEDIKKIIEEYAEVIASTGHFNCGICVNVSFIKIVGYKSIKELKQLIIKHTSFKANKFLVERFLLEEIKIAEVNKEMVDFFSPFNNFRCEVNEFEDKYSSYTSIRPNKRYLLAIKFLLSKSNDEKLEKLGLRSFFDSNYIEDKVASIVIRKYFKFLSREFEGIEEKIKEFANGKI